MDQGNIKAKIKAISIFREQESGDHVFYRVDDQARTRVFSVSEPVLIDFVNTYKNAGGMAYFYSEVLAKESVSGDEIVKDIVSEDSSILWENPALRA